MRSEDRFDFLGKSVFLARFAYATAIVLVIVIFGAFACGLLPF